MATATPATEAPRPPGDAIARYQFELTVVDAAFAAAQAERGDAVPCRRGCAACCAAVFDVHPSDAELLRRWLAAEAPTVREDVLRRAEAIAAAVREVLEDWSPDDGLAGLAPTEVTALAGHVDLACPVLGPEGECRAREDRPLLCRLQGLPWRDERTGFVLPDFCRLDPRQVHARPEPIDLGRVHAARAEADLDLPARAGRKGRTFVAAALLAVESSDGD